MYFLFSGEGETDLGVGLHKGLCEGDAYLYGPLTLLTDRIVAEHRGYFYSLIESQYFGFISKTDLIRRFDQMKPLKKFKIPRGEIKYEQGTKYFRNNARALATIAKDIAKEKDDEVVAVLFRDSDGKNSSEQAEWEKKRDSMLNGFLDEDFKRGVPMIPKPVSEAWMLCGLYKQRDPQRNCSELESKSFGTGSQHQLKDKLEEELGEKPNHELLCEKVKSREINFDLADLESYTKFRERLEEVI